MISREKELGELDLGCIAIVSERVERGGRLRRADSFAESRASSRWDDTRSETVEERMAVPVFLEALLLSIVYG